MKELRPAKSRRLFLGIAGSIFTALGIFLFPTSLVHGYLTIIPIGICLVFLIMGLFSVYFSLFYQVKIDAKEIHIGSGFFKKKIQKEAIKGYFLTKIYSEKESEGYVNVLILLLKNGDKKEFDNDSWGANFKVLKKEFSKYYKSLPPVEKVNYQKRRQRKIFKWTSYGGIAIFLLGVLMLANTYNSGSDLMEISGAIAEKPTFQYGRNQKVTRISFKLKEYPEVAFSTVKNVRRLLDWGNSTNVNDKIIVEIAQKSYDSKIAKSIPIDPMIINYDPNTVEIIRLKNEDDNTYIYRENRFEDLSLSIFILLFGAGTFIFYWRKKNAIVIY